MLPVLLIKYAVAGCTAEQITRIFTDRFGPVVARVVTLNKVNYTTGAPFHMFFIHLVSSTFALDQFLQNFYANPIQRIVYQDPWYWNVVIAEPRAPRVEI